MQRSVLRRSARSAIALTLAALGFASAKNARADEQSLIRTRGEHPDYVFDAEPHGLLGYGPFNDGILPGAGFRGTFILVQQGFIPSINNSVGVGVGADFFFPSTGSVSFVVPAVMQWNFWLSTHWAVFGEPGLALGFGNHHDFVAPVFAAGGRYHFNEHVALTLRIGYPAASVGVSFYF